MITVTEALLARLRCWVERGNTFSALIARRKHPELLPEGEVEGIFFCLHSPEELPMGTELVNLEIKIIYKNQIMYHAFEADHELECDWHWAVLDSTLRLYYMGIGEVLDLMRNHRKPGRQAAATLKEEKQYEINRNCT